MTVTFKIKGTMTGTEIYIYIIYIYIYTHIYILYTFLTAKKQTETLAMLALTSIETFGNDFPLSINLCRINNGEGDKGIQSLRVCLKM